MTSVFRYYEKKLFTLSIGSIGDVLFDDPPHQHPFSIDNVQIHVD